MRSSKSRSRSKSNRQRSFGNVVNRVFDSSGPDGKVRGTPQQIIEKYLMLARDAQLSNDRVAEQAFLQHAEHYTRMLSEAQRELAREQESRQGQPGNGNGQAYQGGERGDGPRDRQDQRHQRDDDDEQPYFAPLGAVVGDEGPELVETPEMRHVAQPQSAPREPRENRPPREHRPPRESREQRETRDEQGSEPPVVADAQPDEQARKPRNDRGPRGPRGPRKPREPSSDQGSDLADAGPAAPESSGSE